MEVERHALSADLRGLVAKHGSKSRSNHAVAPNDLRQKSGHSVVEPMANVLFGLQ